MLTFMIGACVVVLIVMACAEGETLEDTRQRKWVNRLADESMKKRTGRRKKYSRAGL